MAGLQNIDEDEKVILVKMYLESGYEGIANYIDNEFTDPADNYQKFMYDGMRKKSERLFKRRNMVMKK